MEDQKGAPGCNQAMRICYYRLTNVFLLWIALPWDALAKKNYLSLSWGPLIKKKHGSTHALNGYWISAVIHGIGIFSHVGLS
mmetsp:Transcript_2909/g.3282  ORF Transcript_2909/g.3282 Transcript_2909/m.3282 type:complete len:82 (-) Transcript_2909:601-846(-)